jgi:5-methylcytosine-specific restriction protein A
MPKSIPTFQPNKGKSQYTRRKERDKPHHWMYNNNRWRNARKMFLQDNPLCAECERQGRIKAAGVVDHIRPHRGNQALFWDMDNWQSLCKSCHDKKTGRGE